jgi:hypothetical protein
MHAQQVLGSILQAPTRPRSWKRAVRIQWQKGTVALKEAQLGLVLSWQDRIPRQKRELEAFRRLVSPQPLSVSLAGRIDEQPWPGFHALLSGLSQAQQERSYKQPNGGYRH